MSSRKEEEMRVHAFSASVLNFSESYQNLFIMGQGSILKSQEHQLQQAK
jgi:hypothetical protein